jgi:hypothetical protein
LSSSLFCPNFCTSWNEVIVLFWRVASRIWSPLPTKEAVAIQSTTTGRKRSPRHKWLVVQQLQEGQTESKVINEMNPICCISSIILYVGAYSSRSPNFCDSTQNNYNKTARRKVSDKRNESYMLYILCNITVYVGA